jgi:hypothetical protein
MTMKLSKSYQKHRIARLFGIMESFRLWLLAELA